ncbi:hypothetical protein QWZ08_17490 [Ferruginibacter paludis]|uniref:hypothetical protein n=1 Tax=Ferruginibacter paludis TaxID=1310417 RepID=UPI0025B384AA|nr:hypothetical protein [Ferruginibacter paludis]MDN3657450.1 hypothetical protein [Ferruginibacter paludis]
MDNAMVVGEKYTTTTFGRGWFIFPVSEQKRRKAFRGLPAWSIVSLRSTQHWPAQ